MNIVDLAPVTTEKEAGLSDYAKGAWRYLRRPLLGVERAAPGAERQFGQMSAKTEKWVGNEATRGGMSRDTENTILKKWWEKNRALADEYSVAKPKSSPFQAPTDQMSKYERFVKGEGEFAGAGSLKSKIQAQKDKDLLDSFSGFGSDQRRLFDIQKEISGIRAADASAVPYAAGGAVLGGAEGYRREGDLKGVLTGAAIGGSLGFAGGKAVGAATREAGTAAKMQNLKSQRAQILSEHGKGLAGQSLRYAARRITDPIVERGRFSNTAERMRFGKLGLGNVLGRGGELVAARAAQGGLLGKGGLIRGGLALDPRIGMNYRLMRHALETGQYGQAARLGKDLAIGSGVQAGKVGLMGALPAYSVYADMSADNPEEASTTSRLAKSIGSHFGMSATLPLGILTWAPSMVLGNENLSLSHQIGNAAGYAGSLISGGPTPKAVDSEIRSREPYVYAAARVPSYLPAQPPLPPGVASRVVTR